MTDTGFDTEGFSTDPVRGLELLKDWAAFAGVGAYLGSTYAYLRLTGQVSPGMPVPALAATIAMGRAGRLLGKKRGALKSILHHEGHCYHARGPIQTTDHEGQSRLRILEDGVLLPTPHAVHSEIATLGEGRYSHWGWGYTGRFGTGGPHTVVLFSTSDNSSPLTNGRNYTYEIL